MPAVGFAAMNGSDDTWIVATLRTNGTSNT
jgi:hypothetical protein